MSSICFSVRLRPPRIYRSSDASALGGQQVPPRAILHGNKIQAGIHVAGHAAVQKIDDDFPRGRGFPVARPHGSCGIDDHHRQARFGGAQGALLGLEFRALVVPDHFADGRLRLFIRQAAFARNGDGRDRAGINEFLDARTPRRIEQVLRPGHVRFVNFARIARPQPVIRGNVIHAPTRLPARDRAMRDPANLR